MIAVHSPGPGGVDVTVIDTGHPDDPGPTVARYARSEPLDRLGASRVLQSEGWVLVNRWHPMPDGRSWRPLLAHRLL